MLKIAISSDHAGYNLKQKIISFLKSANYYYEDLGTNGAHCVDYPDIALKVAEEVAEGYVDRGIIICGTGIGVSITANKVPGIRAALCTDTYSAAASRKHNDANILTFGGRVIGPELARRIVKIWLNADFIGGRHKSRVEKITALENKYCSKIERN